MRHYGDITKINGALVPRVDVFIGGSPCQDLSCAGKRAGFAGSRSVLFMDQIRVVKEMRENVRADRHIRGCSPRYMVWENVPGAFSSNEGEDFRTVLEETARIVEPDCVIPRPPKDKWANAGCIMGDGWSIAWRVHDAQFWGVPQRRRRIALVADFGGESAPEILFERKGLRRDIEESGTAGEGTAADAEGGAEVAVRAYGISSYESNAMKSANPHSGIYEAETARTLDENGGNPACNQGGIAVVKCYDARVSGDDVADTLDASYYKGCGERGNRECTAVACAADFRNGNENPNINGTLQAKSNGGMSLNLNNTVRVSHTVRRLTPLECERLQGYPDGWTDIGEWVDTKGKRHQTTDSNRYKALGNSIALPYWRYLLKRISAQFEYVPTMASLFDGIGGFPYLWESINGKGTCLWASEIEEFPMAVTKMRIGE